jgi:hypothetical protein
MLNAEVVLASSFWCDPPYNGFGGGLMAVEPARVLAEQLMFGRRGRCAKRELRATSEHC